VRCAICGGPIYQAGPSFWHNERHEELVARCKALGAGWIHAARPVVEEPRGG